MSLPEIIAATELIATVPDAIADVFADIQRIARVELPFRSPVFEAHLHWSKSVQDDPANKWLRALLLSALSRQGS